MRQDLVTTTLLVFLTLFVQLLAFWAVVEMLGWSTVAAVIGVWFLGVGIVRWKQLVRHEHAAHESFSAWAWPAVLLAKAVENIFSRLHSS